MSELNEYTVVQKRNVNISLKSISLVNEFSCIFIFRRIQRKQDEFPQYMILIVIKINFFILGLTFHVPRYSEAFIVMAIKYRV